MNADGIESMTALNRSAVLFALGDNGRSLKLPCKTPGSAGVLGRQLSRLTGRKDMNENPQRISRNLSMHFIEKMVRATKRQSLKLANVTFWIDRDGPFAGQLSYSVPVETWNTDKLSSAFIKKLTPDMEQEYIELYRARC